MTPAYCGVIDKVMPRRLRSCTSAIALACFDFYAAYAVTKRLLKRSFRKPG